VIAASPTVDLPVISSAGMVPVFNTNAGHGNDKEDVWYSRKILSITCLEIQSFQKVQEQSGYFLLSSMTRRR
jgi:hypothetical protein